MKFGLSAQHAQLVHAQAQRGTLSSDFKLVPTEKYQGSAGPQAMTLPPWLQAVPDSLWLQAASSAAPLYASSGPCNDDKFLDSQRGEFGNTSPFGCVHPGVALMPNSIQVRLFEALRQQLPARDQENADQSWATGPQVPNPLHGHFDAATLPRCLDVTPSSLQPSQVAGGHGTCSLQRLPPSPLANVLAAVPASWAASTGNSNASTTMGAYVVAASSSEVHQVPIHGYAQPK